MDDDVLPPGAGAGGAGRPCRLTSVPDASSRPPEAAVDVWMTAEVVVVGSPSSSSSAVALACRRPVVASSDSLGSRIPPLT